MVISDHNILTTTFGDNTSRQRVFTCVAKNRIFDDTVMAADHINSTATIPPVNNVYVINLELTKT